MFDDHRHAKSWTKRNERPGFDPVPWYKPESIALGQCRNDQVRFNQRELTPMYCRGPAPKGKYANFGRSVLVLERSVRDRTVGIRQ